MRGLNSNKTQIRNGVFTEIARLAYEGGTAKQLDDLPYKILPGELSTYRDSIFLERAIVGQRLRAAMGMSVHDASVNSNVSDGVDESMIEEKYYEPPLIDVIKFACNACPEKLVTVTDACQGCLEHPCIEVCPKKAIRIKHGRSFIDYDKCIRCGKCVEACHYHAIIKFERPCAKVCGMNAIKSDEYGRAEIIHDKCVSCGMCLVNCPFSAIVDKGQIFQTIKAIQSDTPVYAILAPAVAGQFEGLPSNKIRSAFQALGFKNVVEVAVGADLCTIEEAKDFLEEVPAKIPFMATSCCPAWAQMINRDFPDQADKISMALTPMVLTARLLKKHRPNSKIAFIGPCAAKKLEASRKSVKSYVDFVLTFEEVAGMFNAKGIDFNEIPVDSEPLNEASADGRGFATSGGVAAAVQNYIQLIDPNREIKLAKAEGLAECKKMMIMAKSGKYNGYLLEGMACPGGCIAGAGTLLPINKASQQLKASCKEASFTQAADTTYASWIPDLENFEKTSKKLSDNKE
ncbi:MAG: 4Fe-4S dicluster domain-containing protein [Clostridiales bacterium]|nr:4Fe-4S dicluster domain-containing protein [Clostridiales bacterium]